VKTKGILPNALASRNLLIFKTGSSDNSKWPLEVWSPTSCLWQG